MAKFAAVATFEIVPGRMDDFLPLLLAHRNRCLKDEPGTLRFDVLQPRSEDNKVMLYEVYTDDAAFQVHLDGPHFARISKEVAGMVATLTGTQCSLLD